MDDDALRRVGDVVAHLDGEGVGQASHDGVGDVRNRRRHVDIHRRQRAGHGLEHGCTVGVAERPEGTIVRTRHNDLAGRGAGRVGDSRAVEDQVRIHVIAQDHGGLLAISQVAHVAGDQLPGSRAARRAAEDEARGQRVADHHIHRIGRAVVDHVDLVEAISRQTDRILEGALDHLKFYIAVHRIGIDQVEVVEARRDAGNAARLRIVGADNGVIVTNATGGRRTACRTREADSDRLAIVHRAQMTDDAVRAGQTEARLAVDVDPL